MMEASSRSFLRGIFLMSGPSVSATHIWIVRQWVENVWDASRDDDPFNKQVSIVPLSRLVREIIDAVPIVDADDPEHQDYVFSVSGRHPVPGRSRFKARLDRKLLEALRREAKQAGLDPATVALKPSYATCGAPPAP